MTRQTAIETVNELPKNFTLDELLERLIFIDKVEKGLEQAKKGEVISHKKVVEHFEKKWKK